MTRTIRTLLAASAALLFSACTAVDSTEHCVETRYGDVITPKMDNGLTMTITTATTCFPVKEIPYNATEFKGQTSDPVTITGKYAVVIQYRNVPQLFIDKRTPENAEAQTFRAIEEALGVVMSRRSIADMFGAGRGTYGDSVKAFAQLKVGPNIEIRSITVSDLEPPAAIGEARVAAAVKDQEFEKARKQLQIDSMNARGQIIKATAEAESQAMLSKALETSPAVLKLKSAEAMANGLANACGKATTCIIGGSVMDTWKSGTP